ncbi:MAG: RNA-binding domain-containing protein [Chthoniobacter sp.]|uniref:RNA-binding domain-containing protein n=1 Tax=Chthoniobacter sp. TaxID=2510640 RepID=UPI0032A94B73
MTLEELKVRLKQIEWRDIEYKEATQDVPKRIYKTVSAFANTVGGWVVFGIQEKDGQFTIKGVANADELQGSFIGTLRQKGKFSCAISFKEDVLIDEAGTVLVFYIPEVHRAHKPVHVDGRIDESYVRKGGTTQMCNRDEIEAFFRDAATEHHEDRAVEALDVATCFDADSMKWYRHFFGERHAGHETEAKTDLEFLEHFGLVVSVEGVLRPTRAAILLFGTSAAMHRVLSRQVVDFFIFQCTKADRLPEQRWDDRIESLSEGNLLKAWQRIVEVYRTRFAESRFELDATSMQRKGTPPDYLAFREAVLNLLIHQDYGDQTRKATLTLYADEVEFWNPGASFVSGEEFFKPGDKPVRNTRLRAMLTRIGIGEQANTGIRNIFAHQREMGRVPPRLLNDPVGHAFSVTLSKQTLVSERQKLIRDSLGAQLSDEQAAVFIHCWHRGEIRPLEAQSVCGQPLADTQAILKFLVVQSLLERHADPSGEFFRVAEHLREILAGTGNPVQSTASSLFTEQVKPDAGSLSTEQAPALGRSFRPTMKHLLVLAYCTQPRSISQIMSHLGVTSRQHVKYQYLDPLLRDGWLRMTEPDRPTSPTQAYVTTDLGQKNSPPTDG